MQFTTRLNNLARKNNSLLCVGLDPDRDRMPKGTGVFEFIKGIIEATIDLVCTYKLNLAFYEAMGCEGFDVLKRIIEYIPDEIPVIGDAKRGDIGNTAKAYAHSLFTILKFSAATVNPYLGYDSLEPFIEYSDRGIFILCRTSNAGATDFQSKQLKTERGNHCPLFEFVAHKASQWNIHGNIGLVVGATYPEELRVIRKHNPDMPILIPGVGTQGGDVSLAVRYGVDAQGEKAIINSSRQILYASHGRDYAKAARRIAARLRDQINSYKP